MKSKSNVNTRVFFSLTYFLLFFISQFCQAQDLDVTFNVSHYNNGTNISCNGATNGTIEAVIVGGNSPYSYSWNTGAFTKSITNLSAGTYTFTVTDANGATRTKDVTLIEPEPLYLNITLSEHNGYSISQQGGDDGIITANVGGGSPPYTYLWSNGGDKEEARHVIAGNYSVVVTDANGCVINQSATLTEPTPLHVVSITSPQHHGFNISCYGGNDGAIDLTVAGGVPPYKYTWTGDGGFSEDLTGLSSGDYSVRIEDGNHAEVTAFIALTEPADFKVVLTRQQYANGFNLSCHDCSNGSATAVLTGGAAPFTYLWNYNQTTATITGLQAIEYSVVATDINGCTVAGVTNLHAPDRDDWSMTGNLNTDPNTQFMGTTDNKDFVLRTNNVERFRITNTGNIKINSAVGSNTRRLLVDPTGALAIGDPVQVITPCGNLTIADPWYRTSITGQYGGTNVINCNQQFGFGIVNPVERIHVIGFARFSANNVNSNSYLNIGYSTVGKMNSFGSDMYINDDSQTNLRLCNASNGGSVYAAGSVYLASARGKVQLFADNDFDPKSFQILKNDQIPVRRGISIDDDPGGKFNFYINSWQNNSSFNFLKKDESNQSIQNLFSINEEGVVSVGEGSSLPAGYIFGVHGKMIAEEVLVKLQPWPDFVFDGNYSLMSLSDLEKYIHTNNHLPNVPKASEIENAGLSVGEMLAKQMEKVEELTLYIIELKKELDEFKTK